MTKNLDIKIKQLENGFIATFDMGLFFTKSKQMVAENKKKLFEIIEKEIMLRFPEYGKGEE